MAEVKFGPLYSRIHELVGVKEFADTTVQMGFDSIWIPDTMITREHALDWAPTLGAFVEHTQDIMLGTCVVVVPHRHPLSWRKRWRLSTTCPEAGSSLESGPARLAPAHSRPQASTPASGEPAPTRPWK